MRWRGRYAAREKRAKGAPRVSSIEVYMESARKGEKMRKVVENGAEKGDTSSIVGIGVICVD